jgi:superfamily II DNA or RNA helicase
VNTVIFLRPTESLTVFLQQLGRGLRLSEGKEALTVLDFVGQAHKKYSFEDRFKALLSRTRKTVEHEIKNGFANVPEREILIAAALGRLSLANFKRWILSVFENRFRG